MWELSPEECHDLESQLARGELVEDVIVALNPESVGIVYNVEVSEDHTFVANGFVVHNSDICRHLHGKVLETAHAVRTFERLERAKNPELLKQERPWVRERMGQDGKRELYVKRGKQETVLAIVERSGVGNLDDVGEYSRVLPPGELAPAGVNFPPLHGHCRTTCIPEP